MSFLNEFQSAMKLSAAKVVSRNDIKKKAYHTDKPQQGVMSNAGIEPVSSKLKRVINIRVAGSDEILYSSYYASRLESYDREVEPRIGRDLINWVREGETLWLGTDGRTIFAFKSSLLLARTTDRDAIDLATERLGRHLNLKRLLGRALASTGIPDRIETRSMAFERNPWVRELARKRSGGRCEMPECDYTGFLKDDGSAYIEVHHIDSLARKGADIIENVAAICPNCHAKVHHARNRAALNSKLFSAVQDANERFLKGVR